MVATLKPCGFELLDVVDGDAVRLGALNLVERELVVAFGLQRRGCSSGRRRGSPAGSAARPAGRRCSRALHLGGVGVARREVKRPAPRPSRNEPSNDSVPASRRRSNLTLDAREGVVVGAGRRASSTGTLCPMLQPPLQSPRAGPVGRRGGPNLEVDTSPRVILGGPGAVDVGRTVGCAAAAAQAWQDEQEGSSQVAHARLECGTGEEG